MKNIYKSIKKHPLTFLSSIFILYHIYLSLYLFPHQQISSFNINNSATVATLENQYRTTQAQIIGGGAVLISLYFAWGNLKTAKDGQITERFTRAVNQLGDKELQIRLGGIYALERISKESKEDYWPIMEILTAYVRQHSPLEKTNTCTDLYKGICSLHGQYSEVLERKLKNQVAIDIKAILNIIKKRNYMFSYGEPNGLDLRRTYLREAHLERAHLENANFIGAFLESAHLEGAYLENALFLGANLENADLRGTDLRKACFEETVLAHANLKGANLEDARNLDEDQLSKVHSLCGTKLDNELKKKLQNKGYSYLFEC